jgi:hypothetical protein
MSALTAESKLAGHRDKELGRKTIIEEIRAGEGLNTGGESRLAKYECKACGMTFRTEAELKAHNKKVHKK